MHQPAPFDGLALSVQETRTLAICSWFRRRPGSLIDWRSPQQPWRPQSVAQPVEALMRHCKSLRGGTAVGRSRQHPDGRKKPGRAATHRQASGDGPPPGTTQWTWG
jgi:hypothetical protein